MKDRFERVYFAVYCNRIYDAKPQTNLGLRQKQDSTKHNGHAEPTAVKKGEIRHD